MDGASRNRQVVYLPFCCTLNIRYIAFAIIVMDTVVV